MFRITQKPKPLLLCILDGWGVSQDNQGNAITRANPTYFNNLWHLYPHTLLVASGQSVGLPEGKVGNSEVGHLNLGAGRIVLQDVLRINTAIADGTFYENEAFLKAIEHIGENGSNIHLLGLVGLSNVHSDIEHLYALLRLLQKEEVPSSRVKLHLFTDGRDSPPTSAKIYLTQLQTRLVEADFGQIASISGRYYAMDRDNRWDRTEKSYKAILGQSEKKATDVLRLIEDSYIEGLTDEFIKPTTIVDDAGIPLGPVSDNDSVIFFNYRPDRTRQLTKAFVLENLNGLKTSTNQPVKTFNRGPRLQNLFFVSLTKYESTLPVSMVAFSRETVTMPLARVFAERNSQQLHIAETEKYAHVTYFFNGGNEEPFPGEERILVNSPKVASYDLTPEMATPQITKELIGRINTQVYDFVVVNFANSDMVSHTGNIEATIKGVKCIDFHLGLLARAVLDVGGGLIITSDHGNAEEMINLRTGEVDTEHNINPVPCILVLKELQGNNIQLPQGLLADVAPTILGILQIPKPSQMTGRNLLQFR